MRPRHQTVITIAGLALLASALPALAHPPGPGGPGGRGGFGDGRGIEWMAEQLELSDAQLGELRELHAARLEEGPAARTELFAARRALAEQIHAESFDEAAIRAAAAALARLEADLAVGRAEHYQSLRQILTPEQLEELETLRAERRRFGGPRGRRGPRFGGPHGPRFGGPPPADE